MSGRPSGTALRSGAADAGTRDRSGLEPRHTDRLSTRFALPVGAPHETGLSGVQLNEVALRLFDQRADLRALERDRRPLGIVFVVGVGVDRGCRDVIEVPLQRVESPQGCFALVSKPSHEVIVGHGPSGGGGDVAHPRVNGLWPKLIPTSRYCAVHKELLLHCDGSRSAFLLEHVARDYRLVMVPELILLPSPLLGPATWQPVAECLHEAGWSPSIASPAESAETPDDVMQALMASVPTNRDVVLIPHSNAGLYAPGLAKSRRVVATIFVDAALPPAYGSAGLAPRAFLEFLAERADEDGQLPPWSQWWTEADLEGLYPDSDTRRRVQSEERRLPLTYFQGSLSVPSHWVTTPCAYLAFGDTYGEERHQAEGYGWPVRTIQGGHLHALHDPQHVATAIAELLTELRAPIPS